MAKILPLNESVNTCIICLENLDNNIRIISNSCNCLTLAHNECANIYTQNFNNCPFCRKELNNTTIIAIDVNNLNNNNLNNIEPITINLNVNNNKWKLALILNFFLALFFFNPIITIININYYQNLLLKENYEKEIKNQNPEQNIDKMKFIEKTFNDTIGFLNFSIMLSVAITLCNTYFSLIYFWFKQHTH